MNLSVPHRRLLVALATSALVATSGFSAAADELASWKVGQAREQDGGWLVPDVKKSYDLLASDATGITLGEKPSVGDDTKSLVFDGNQLSAFRTLSPFPVSTGSLSFSVAAKPSASQPDEIGGTILRYGTQWELRYEQGKQAFVFIVWHEDRTTYTTVRVDASPDQWHLVNGSLEQDMLVLSVGGDTKQSPLKGAMVVEPKPASFVVGASRATIGTTPGARPFVGAIAAIKATAQ